MKLLSCMPLLLPSAQLLQLMYFFSSLFYSSKYTGSICDFYHHKLVIFYEIYSSLPRTEVPEASKHGCFKPPMSHCAPKLEKCPTKMWSIGMLFATFSTSIPCLDK